MKNVLITGASHGIGRACAERFAAENGFRVFLNYNLSAESAAEISEKTGAIPVKFDVSNAAEVNSAIDKIDSDYGGIDILINNAGVSSVMMLADTTEEEYERVFGTNMRGVYLVTRRAMRSMVKKHAGKIVNISSMWGVFGGSCEVCYSASKAAVIGFTKALAKELGPTGINVNCVAPGVIKTRMNDNLSGEDMRALAEETALMRIGEPEEVAEAVYFLASDAASYITGEVLNVNGGIL